jgi:hypothetical protein
MFPSRRQLSKWSLPTKWSFWSAAIGLPLAFLSAYLGLVPMFAADQALVQRNQLLLQTAQELRYNDEWLANLCIAAAKPSRQLPIGSIKTDGLLRLMEQHHDWIVREAYGEEKYIYQMALELRDIATSLDSREIKSILSVIKGSEYTLNDIHFLNNFLFWYLRPHIEEGLNQAQIYSLGWNWRPQDNYKIPTGTALQMNRFLHDGKPITEYVTYLGIID